MNSKPKLNQKFSQTDSRYNNEDWYNGSIKSITLVNFLCHSNFHLKFNPRINFISGLSGSGKSAIQFALVVGFGAKANTAKYISSLKTLIKYGKPSATISITIANSIEVNCDRGPYKPEVYGNQITIVTQITNSSSSYILLNENNKVVKSDKNELNNLKLHYNILVDNPICIMNQEMVKSFHTTANPNEKYDLFCEVVSANVHSANIVETKSVAMEHLEKLKYIESVLKQYFNKVGEYEIYKKKSEQLKTLKNSLFQFKLEHSWYVIDKLETTVQKNLNDIDALGKCLSENADVINSFKQNIKIISEKLKVKQNELANIEDSRSHHQMVFIQIKKELQDKICDFDLVKQSERKHDSVLKLLISNRKDLEKHIEVERRRKGSTNTLPLRCRMTTLTEEIYDIDLKIANAKEIKDKSMITFQKFEEEILIINQRLEKCKSIIEKTDPSPILEEIKILQTQLNTFKTELLQIDSTEDLKSLSNLRAEVDKEKKKLEENKKQLGKKMQVTRNGEDIKRDLEETNHKCQLLEMELKKTVENHLASRDEYKEKKVEYILSSDLHKYIVDIYHADEKSIKFSILALKDYIMHVRLKVMEAFDLVMILRKIKGKLEIDEHERSMVISMFNDISTAKMTAFGDGRTFSTAALILALWNNMQLPFYSIDDYDVYMDNVNRLANTQLLMLAVENRKNQFIFLTRRDMSIIKSADNVKIVKLRT